MNYQIKEVITKTKMNLPKKVILENAFDPYHVERVHFKTVKSVKVIYDNGCIGTEDTFVRTRNGMEYITMGDKFPFITDWN